MEAITFRWAVCILLAFILLVLGMVGDKLGRIVKELREIREEFRKWMKQETEEREKQREK